MKWFENQLSENPGILTLNEIMLIVIKVYFVWEVGHMGLLSPPGHRTEQKANQLNTGWDRIRDMANVKGEKKKVISTHGMQLSHPKQWRKEWGKWVETCGMTQRPKKKTRLDWKKQKKKKKQKY